jgi:hypothetical protein
MDKLPEPEFENDKNWPRLKLGVDDYVKKKEARLLPLTIFFASASIWRYGREIYFYKKNALFFFPVVIPTFIFASYNLARFLCFDPHAYAAQRNNINENMYIEHYRGLYKEAQRKNIAIPDALIR